MNVLVFGVQGLDRYPLMILKLDRLTRSLDRSKLVILLERGDSSTEKWCFDHFIKYKVFHAERVQDGRERMIQNMIDEADAVIAFAPVSDALRTMAEEKGITIRVIKEKK